MSRLLLWIKAFRAPFFIGPIMSAFIASAPALAFNEGHFSWVYLMFSIIIVGINAGINLTNDCFDHINRNDEVNRYPNVFSGGSRCMFLYI